MVFVSERMMAAGINKPHVKEVVMSEFLEFAYFKDQFMPFKEANVSVATHALQYGISVFGGIRGYRAEDGSINIFRLHDHMTRFTRSASLLKIALPGDVQTLMDVAIELTRRNAPTTDVYYRPFAFKSDLALGPSIGHKGAGFALYMLPLGNYFGGDKPLSLCVSSWRRVSDAAMPARGKIGGAYVNSAIAKDDAVINGFDDAIMMNDRGKVGEGSAANLFMVRDGVLITPPVTADILEGITRRTAMELARDLGIPVLEREIDRSELYICDELFLCGTAAQISPVGQVDRREIGDPACPITTRLRQTFEDAVRGRLPQYTDWLTPVRVPVTTGAD
jgi:branched-chain amino acid aminotransferase